MKNIALPKTILALGVVSFLTDLSSEMIYPLLPIFIAVELGGGAAALGLVEGLALAAAAIVKVFSGLWAERLGKLKPPILGGYALSGLSRPLMALAASWPWLAVARLTDRMGKGLRSAPRDALIVQSTPAGQLGRAFGLHRSMDHAGAVVGPLLAALLLNQPGTNMRHVFWLAVIPALAVLVVIALGVKEPAAPLAQPQPAPRLDLRRDWAAMGMPFRRLMLACLVFALANSADAFLLLRLSETGAEPWWIAVLWSVFHMVKMTGAYHFGSLSDRLGHRLTLALGWAFYATIYLAFAMATQQTTLTFLFLAYGFYYGLAEPAERALVGGLAPRQQQGAAFGLFHALTGIMALPASLLFGLIWKYLGAPSAFIVGAALAAAGLALLFWSEWQE